MFKGVVSGIRSVYFYRKKQEKNELSKKTGIHSASSKNSCTFAIEKRKFFHS